MVFEDTWYVDACGYMDVEGIYCCMPVMHLVVYLCRRRQSCDDVVFCSQTASSLPH